jgi:outer membrane murein-binding lipoprotein Lpp
MTKYNAVIYAGLLGILLVSGSAFAAKSNDISQFKKLLAQQSKQLEAQQKILDSQNNQLNELQSRLDELSGNKPVLNEPGTIQQRQSAKPKTSESLAQTRKPSSDPRQQQNASIQPRLREMPKSTKPPEIPRVSADVGGVLTPKGRLVLEPAVSYAYSKATRVAIEGFSIIPALTIGIVNVRDVKRETETVALTGRYGLTDRIELEARVPYLRREDTTQTRRFLVPDANDRFFNADGMDIGDIEVAGHYQINDGKGGWPFLIGNLRFKTDTGVSPFDVPIDPRFNIPTELPTGTGFLSFQPSLTAIFPSDPAVFFGNVSYLWNVEKDIGGQRLFTEELGKAPTSKPVGKIDPGDAIGFSFGTSLAFNEKSSFSLAYSHNIYFKTKQNGLAIDGSDFDVGQFIFGLNYAFAKKTSANLAVAIGATRDAPDVQMTLRVPVGFDLF